MATHLTTSEVDYSILAGENFGFGEIPGTRDGSLNELIQRILRRDCNAVSQLATPSDLALSTVARELAGNIAADLETRLSMAALRRGQRNDLQGQGDANDPLDTWAIDILAWTGFPAPAKSVDNQPSDDSEYSDDSGPTAWEADKIALCYESFMLFVAHHVKAHSSGQAATGGFKPEDCRLILPITSKDTETERIDIRSADYVDPVDFATVECGMFPLSDNSVKRQTTPAPHLFVANTEIARDQDDRNLAERMLATKTKALYFDQHNRRFVWGLIASSRTIHAYVFGTDDIWASTAMDISSEKGRRAFISLLVGWSLCSVDRLGFDPSIRHVIGGSVGGPYLEIDVHKMDESTGKVKPHTYYSQRCVGAADRLTGRHARYFAASASPNSMDTPTFLIKDMWTTSGSTSANDSRESSFLNVLHVEFDKSSEFSSIFSRLVSSGPVYISRGDTVIADSTVTAFAGLPAISCVRQHRRTVTKWAGNMISEANNQSQVVVAVINAMTALNVAYAKCKILHGNISDRAILLQQTVDGIRGVLTDFDYACYAGDLAAEAPELMIFRSILSLEGARPIRSLLDDLESLLYLVCWLGTFGINQNERREYAARYAAGPKLILPIMYWNRGTAAQSADHKRNHMDTALDFETNILSYMRKGPLRPLAMDLHRTLFLHPGCSGAKKTAWA
ncbi:hypothetical protein H4R27_000154 [Coemansia aciculifera]|nr:hypothetical protein H4R27_000154 [Coemansia aciculifera]